MMETHEAVEMGGMGALDLSALMEPEEQVLGDGSVELGCQAMGRLEGPGGQAVEVEVEVEVEGRTAEYLGAVSIVAQVAEVAALEVEVTVEQEALVDSVEEHPSRSSSIILPSA